MIHTQCRSLEAGSPCPWNESLSCCHSGSDLCHTGGRVRYVHLSSVTDGAEVWRGSQEVAIGALEGWAAVTSILYHFASTWYVVVCWASIQNNAPYIIFRHQKLKQSGLPKERTSKRCTQWQTVQTLIRLLLGIHPLLIWLTLDVLSILRLFLILVISHFCFTLK